MQNIARVYKITGLISIMLMSSFFVAGQTGANANAAMEVYADTLLGRADYKGALELYNKLIESSKPSSTEQYQLLYKRAVCYYGLQNFETALKEINVVIEKYPEAQSKLLRAYIYQELGNYDAQLADLNDMLSENPDNLELIQWRVSVLMEAGKYEEAQKDIRKLLSFQSSPELKSYLGLSYYYQGDPDSAMIIYDEVLKEDPGFTQAYIYAASLSMDEQAYTLSLNYIDNGLKSDPSNMTLLFYKGIALAETDKTKEGCRHLTKAFQNGVDEAGDYLKQYCYGVE
jgi:tetratricopeptide (TPR) repeat protein